MISVSAKAPKKPSVSGIKEKVLADAVWVIRQFQPDVIITRFPPDSRAGHGHHSASAVIARLAFEAAADPKRFPEQFAFRREALAGQTHPLEHFQFRRQQYYQ